MLPRLVLFDIDGTLLSLGASGRESLDAALRERYGHDRMSLGVPFGGRRDPEIVEDILRRKGCDPTDTTHVIADYLSHLERRQVAAPAPLMPGVAAIVETLAVRDDVCLGLVTGNVAQGARIKLSPTGILDHFAFGAFGDEADDRAGLIALARTRASERSGKEYECERVYYVGDTVHDVRAARDSGVVGIAVASGGQSEEELDGERPDHLFSSLDPKEPFLEVVLS